MSDTDYCYPPDYSVLKNKLNLRDSDELEYFEREFVYQRTIENVPSGNFDLPHLKAIHHHLFQDIYEWAGQIRTVEISKGGTQFQMRRYIETGMADVHQRLVAQDFLRDLSPEKFADAAGEIIGDINHVHPFREGNGRTQLVYLKQLARQADHDCDLTKIDETGWLEACRQAHIGNYQLISACIAAAIF
jgi:cell filamentation protein